MIENLLKNHKYQFIMFCYVYHAEASRANLQVNDDLHLIHVTKGSGIITMDDSACPISRGTVVAVQPFTGFRLQLNPGVEMLNIHYRLWLGNGTPLEEYRCLPTVFRPHYFPAVEESLRRIFDGYYREDKPDRLLAEAEAHRVVLQHLSANELRRCSPASGNVMADLYRMLLLDEMQAFDAGKAAAACNLSISQMNRSFIKAFGRTPRQFWDRRRFSRACILLAETDNSVAELALRLGFSDQTYFSRWFKRMSGGQSPQAYRQASIGREAIY